MRRVQPIWLLAVLSACVCAEKAIISTDNITYSETFGLMLHMFEPPASDKRKQRPAMVMIHGPCQPCR